MKAMRSVVLAAVVCAAAAAWADGVIVPIRPDLLVRGTWAVKYHHVNMIVRDQVASVTIDQEFVNTGNGMIEVEYLFPVAPYAAIDAMTLMVNGQEFKGKLMAAAEARQVYESIVRSKRDPALLEYVGFGLYRTKAFPLEPNKPAKVLIHYNQVCRKTGDTVEVMYPLNTEKFSAKAIEDVSVTADIRAGADITTVYSPSHEIKTEQKEPRHAVVTYGVKNAIPNTDFVVLYKARDEDVGATLLTYQPEEQKDGYFMLLATPNMKTAAAAVQPKDVVILVDRSGSMSSDKKMDQAKEALRFILKNLNPGDRFNIIAYSDYVEPFFKQLTETGSGYIEQALDKVDRLETMGATNISDALKQAMQMIDNRIVTHLREQPDAHSADLVSTRPAYVIFLTDGQPTIGNKNIREIVAETRKANVANARIFALGVGYDVNVQLLDKLVEENYGSSDYVRPAEPLEAKVSGMYNKIRNPVLTNVKVDVAGVETTDRYPRAIGDLFHGSQLIVVGRYSAANIRSLSDRRGTLVISGQYEGKTRTFEYPVIFKEPGRSSTDSFIERLWAMRRVGYLLDQVQVNGESSEVVDEIVRLSRDYGIITPYTSFLADETTRLQNGEALREMAADAATALRGSGVGGKAQADAENRQILKDTPRPAAATETVEVDGKGRATRKPATWGVGFGNEKDYEAGTHDAYTTVRQVGGQTLYRRGTTWMTPETTSIDLDKDAAKVKKIARYSDEYFELARKNTVAENQVIAGQGPDEQLLIKLRGQVYLIQ